MNHELAGAEDVVVGRSKKSDIRVQDARVSTKHCTYSRQLLRNGDVAVSIEDQGSSNGTFVNGRKLVKWRKRQLHNGDEVSANVFKVNNSNLND